MLVFLRKKLVEADGRLKVGYTRRDGGGSQGVLVALDEIGVIIEGGDGVRAFPWAGLQRIRLV